MKQSNAIKLFLIGMAITWCIIINYSILPASIAEIIITKIIATFVSLIGAVISAIGVHYICKEQ